jgi:integrase
MKQQAEVIEFSQHRKKRKRNPLNSKNKGSIFNRNGWLWVDFYYLGQRVREPSGLKNTPENQKDLRKQLDLIVAEIENGVFEFAKRFKHSKKKEYFTKLEIGTLKKDPQDVYFGEYVEKWWQDMEPGMSASKNRDYTSILKVHLLPNFSPIPFSKLTHVLIKKFVSKMKGKKTRAGTPLSAKRIQNIMIPLKNIVRDGFDEFGWTDLADPFAGLKLPTPRRAWVNPFSYDEWNILMGYMRPWYRPYFEFAVQTGLRPSEQVALKWTAIDSKFVKVELSRVRNREKKELKTPQSYRRIEIRPAMVKTLRAQRELSVKSESPYVFLNTQGRPILQDKLRELWARVMKKSELKYRRMYETRHTFASWALEAGETPEWVAKTLGHSDTSMVYKTYGCYIPNLTRQDGSAFEKTFTQEVHSDDAPK